MEIKDVENGRSGKEQGKKQPWILYGAIGLASIAAIIFIILFALEKGKLDDAEAANGAGGNGKNHPDGPNGAESWKEFASNLMTFYPSKVSDFDNDGNYVVGAPLLAERHMLNKEGYRYSNVEFPDVADDKLRVMQFNMLADGLCGVYDDPTKGKSFGGPMEKQNQHILYWNYRINLIVEEIRRSKASIITVQENDHFHDLLDALKLKDSGNWDGVWEPKAKSPCINIGRGYDQKTKNCETGVEEQRTDGTSIYWRTDKVTIDKATLKREPYEANPSDPKKELKQIWIGAEFTIKSNDEKVLVISTHLDSDKDVSGEAGRVLQARQLMKKINTVFNVKEKNTRVILTGDLNGFDKATTVKPESFASKLIKPLEIDTLESDTGVWYTDGGDVLKFYDESGNHKVDYIEYGSDNKKPTMDVVVSNVEYLELKTGDAPTFKISRFGKIVKLIDTKGKAKVMFEEKNYVFEPESKPNEDVSSTNPLKVHQIYQLVGTKFGASNGRDMQIILTDDPKKYQIKFYTVEFDKKVTKMDLEKNIKLYDLVYSEQEGLTFKIDAKIYKFDFNTELFQWKNTNDVNDVINCYKKDELELFPRNYVNNFDAHHEMLFGTWYTPYMETITISPSQNGTGFKFDVKSQKNATQQDEPAYEATLSKNANKWEIEITLPTSPITKKKYRWNNNNSFVLFEEIDGSNNKPKDGGEKIILIKDTTGLNGELQKQISEKLNYSPATYNFIVNGGDTTWNNSNVDKPTLKDQVNPFAGIAKFFAKPDFETKTMSNKELDVAYTYTKDDYALRTILDFQSSQAKMNGEPKCTTAKLRGSHPDIHTEDFIFYRGDLDPVAYMSYLDFSDWENLNPMSSKFKNMFLPRFDYPSDHMAVVTEFQLTNVTQKKAGGDGKNAKKDSSGDGKEENGDKKEGKKEEKKEAKKEEKKEEKKDKK